MELISFLEILILYILSALTLVFPDMENSDDVTVECEYSSSIG